jgi:transposase
VYLFEDESDVLLFPPLRAAWQRRGHRKEVMISGRNAKRVIFGVINIHTGHRLLLEREKQRADDFQTFLRLIRRKYRGWRVVLLLDGDRSHDAKRSQALAGELGMKLIWLPVRSPELNAMEHLWKYGKQQVCANRQYKDIESEARAFIRYLEQLSAQEALRKSGLTSPDFWLFQ